MTGWNLPPGCTQSDIDRAFGGDEDGYYGDDYAEPDYEDRCLHIDYDETPEDAWVCVDCGHRWYPTVDEIRAYEARKRQLAEWERQQQRLERWREFWASVRWPIYRLLERLWPPRKTCWPLLDDEIPF
jgi:hypothetical protein